MEKDELLAYCAEEILDELEQTETEENDGSDEDSAYLFGKRVGLCTAISIIQSAVRIYFGISFLYLSHVRHYIKKLRIVHPPYAQANDRLCYIVTATDCPWLLCTYAGYIVFRT